MATTDTLSVNQTGLEEAIAAMDEIHPRMRRYVISKAVAKGAQVLVKGMRSKVPASMHKLRKSIKLKKLRATARGLTYIVGPSWPDGALINFVEFGTGAVRDPEGNRGGSTAIGREYEISGANGVSITDERTEPADLIGRWFPKVKHPGIKPTPIVRPAMLQYGETTAQVMSDAAVALAEDELEKLGRDTIPEASRRRAGW